MKETEMNNKKSITQENQKSWNAPDDLSAFIHEKLMTHGADLAGFADLRKLPSDARRGLPTGIVVAIRLPKDIVKGIAELPTTEYYEQYNTINKKLDALVEYGAEILQKQGYRAIALTREYVSQSETDYSTKLPHKTIATRAGLGWIGKSALLVTEAFGSAIRISSILTDAPLKTGIPMNQSLCKTCMICKENCPADAVTGKNWSLKTTRDEIFDAHACRETARKRSLKNIGVEVSLCGRCIVVCPYTQKYLTRK
jgi:epoxyqueuosine reductase